MSDSPLTYVCNRISDPFYLFTSPAPPGGALRAFRERDYEKIYKEDAKLADVDELSIEFNEQYEGNELNEYTEEMDKKTYSKPYPSLKEFLVLVPKVMGTHLLPQTFGPSHLHSISPLPAYCSIGRVERRC